MDEPLTILPVPCLSDNFAWLLVRGRQAVVVDPGEAAPVEAALSARAATLAAIVVTHHHRDHVGGIDALVAARSGASPAVHAGAEDVARGRIPHARHAHAEGAVFSLLGTRWQALHTPGHTLGATCYWLPEQAAVFTGDTLFLSGCGRLLEGTAAEHWRSLVRLSRLPDATRIFCGHEYTDKNVAFAESILPDDAGVSSARARVRAARSREVPTAPASMAEERAQNLFLRCHEAPLGRALGAAPGLPAFVALRQRRDQF